VNERSAIEPHRRDDRRRLAFWFGLIAFFIVVQYAGRSSGELESDPLYKWSFAVGSLVQEGIFLLIVLAIAGFSARRLGLRLPQRKWLAVGLVIGSFFLVLIFEGLYNVLVHPGNEQGLTPDRWQPKHAAAYVANAVIICTVVPFVEELTFRGLGFYLLRPYGAWVAVLGNGVLFGLSHGLVLSLPIIVVFGCVLAWIREETGSVFPGMFLHAVFNLAALVAAVTLQR
jgi:membrane protease YdiL (CAAX protease family)